MNSLTIRRPDDWHLHLRDGAMMEGVIGDTARHFGRAIIMPNLVPPVVTAVDAAAYRDRIVAALPAGARFTPLMTLYLTETPEPADVASAFSEGLIKAVKLYPAGATTNSASGVRNIDNAMPVLEKMAEIGLNLCVHGEVTDKDVDIFDREAVFIETVLDKIRWRLPELKITMEHVTTRDGVDYIKDARKNLAGSLTTHHLIINRTDIFKGGIRPHLYCLPIAKREVHRQALVKAATSGSAKFFLGTDTAPHARHAKEAACGCAGIFSAPAAIEVYAEAFDQAGALDKLEAFASLNGPAFYGLPVNETTITLERADWTQPEAVDVSTADVDGADAEELYACAIDVLIHIHDRAPEAAIPRALPPYDERKLLEEAALLIDWYLPAMTGQELEDEAREEYLELWRAPLRQVLAQPKTLVLRDYHVDNLIWLPDRDGVRRCGLLDFQDAVAGSPVYDLMSLLEDARRAVDPVLTAHMLARYLAAFPDLDRDALGASYAILGAQRHAKVIGIFTRLSHRDDKPLYLRHIPHVWSLLEHSLTHPVMAPVKAWLDDAIPADKRVVPPPSQPEAAA